jgi:hypothetical protein
MDTSDRVALRRWLMCVGILDSASGLASRGSAAEALVVADAAAETALWLLADWGSAKLGDKTPFGALIEAAIQSGTAAGAELRRPLASQLNAAHGLRNAVVHRGSVAPPDEARAAVEATRELLELLPAVASHFRAVPSGGGLASAVAELIDAPDVQEQLRLADQALRAEDAGAAADAAGRALGRAMARSTPGLGVDDHGHADLGLMQLRSLSGATGHDREVLRALERVDARVSDLEKWVLSLAVGGRPVDHTRLGRIVGRRIVYATRPPKDEMHREAMPHLEDAAWAVRLVAEIVYRMKEVGSMIEGTWG